MPGGFRRPGDSPAHPLCTQLQALSWGRCQGGSVSGGPGDRALPSETGHHGTELLLHPGVSALKPLGLCPAPRRGFPGGSEVKKKKKKMHQPMQETQETWVHTLIRKIPWRRKWQPPPVFLPGKFHGQKSLAGYSPWGCKALDMTERTRTHAFVCLNTQNLQRPRDPGLCGLLLGTPPATQAP